MERLWRAVLIAGSLAFSWVAMMAVHEAGHVLHLWLSGGAVERVSLPPFSFSQTFARENPHPLFVAWGGAVWGCAIPLLLFGLARLLRWRVSYLFRFFAGFCMIANGAYLGVGSFIPGDGDDASDIMKHGSPQWSLGLFGLVAVAVGLRAWHNLGPHFGLGPNRVPVSRQDAVGVLSCFLVLLVLEILLARA